MSFNILRLGLLPCRLSMAFIEYVNRIHCPLKLWLPWIALGLQLRCSVFYKPQAMNNINDCAIQLLL